MCSRTEVFFFFLKITFKSGFILKLILWADSMVQNILLAVKMSPAGFL